MESKVKINISKKVLSILDKDALDFEFLKSDGSINRNDFLNTLIINYYSSFQEKRKKLNEYTKLYFKKANAGSSLEIDDFSSLLLDKVNQLDFDKDDDNCDCHIALKPTKASSAIFQYIETYLLKTVSFSSYFRMMFSSYSLLSQDEREAIIFKQQYDSINKAISEKKKIFIVHTNRQEKSIEISPYALTVSREENHCYLLATLDVKPLSYRLSRISSVSILEEVSSFEEEQKDTFKKMIKYGPQYIYDYKQEEAEVTLTLKGEEMFKKLYIYRPQPLRKEGNSYFFDCSYQQILQYFTRFGSEAKIIRPYKLYKRMMCFYQSGFESYKSNNK